MASGSYSKRSSPQQPIEVDTFIPARRTRLLAETVVEEEEESTFSTMLNRTIEKTGQLALPLREKIVFDGRQEHPLERHLPWLKPVVICSIVSLLFVTILLSAAMLQRPGGQSLNYMGGSVYNVDSKNWRVDQPLAPKVALPPATSTGPYSVLGTPTIPVEMINKILAAANSPAAGKGQSLYDMGVKYGIDPAFALAFFQHESTFGTRGEARSSLSLGNLRCIKNAACVNTSGQNCQPGESCYAAFPNWESGFEAWYQLIRNLYVAQWGLTTIDTIIPTYAPNADNNNEQAYINSLKHALDTWRAGNINA